MAAVEDDFLVRIVNMRTASERQRMRNLRKIYPIDPGLIAVYERAGRENRGRSLGTAVLLELERRGSGDQSGSRPSGCRDRHTEEVAVRRAVAVQ
ncbi:MAG: ATP-binding protein [Gemmatimonadetes bacterium]|nr:ATP-binding protein [Gemmatimonadota bacterium]